MQQTSEQPKIWKIARSSINNVQDYEWEMRPRADRTERIRDARKYHKKLLLDNPGKTMADFFPELLPEMLDDMETDVRSHWDEIEVQ
ncbi:hypothetical protein FACS18942_00720 [Planctomycetales bacterium]|nr:hypothetical protein FACS18942_00720 [Planctomycetales bacterium]GHT34614.1 hypothetical protein FACS189427_02230 [Planctomycetales bacterium]